MGRSGSRLFLLLILMQNWFSVDAAARRLEPKGEAEVPEIITVSDAVGGTFADLDAKSLREEQQDEHYREWKRSRGADRTEMRKEEKRLRCALLNGSAWSTENKNMRRYKGKFDIFLGIEHRLRRNSSIKRPRKDGDLRRVQQETLRKRQEMRIASSRQEELW